MNHNDQEIRKKIRKHEASKNLSRPLKAFTFEMDLGCTCTFNFRGQNNKVLYFTIYKSDEKLNQSVYNLKVLQMEMFVKELQFCYQKSVVV